ncbi:LysM peptidoglycan-binding domain-containing protein [Parabacteroides sp. AGMB00274]|uniref:LysM peptidoglycan-binding domain-containing protein n=1 Tax=Parabacteroides faecalis TaxID=2924040 RepID=A0ABT0C0K2_9BACT|nr:lytic transglycosylase domain-containing protein [Parabacteroides faecalis]MCI7285984.1 LysM peptidoglycan-binding domain-containing protein [Parabacteroides sp.]MCJ2380535.1 LysM peptidoglycan-binding domain-containing protein [Parabacteroides faecalis]MDY6253560.1 LysM peptidoglycan-binding domain-containing protein [Bacteroidales bacterium]
MKRLVVLLVCLAYGAMPICGQELEQEYPSSTLPADSIVEEIVGIIPESLDSDIDSLLHSWHVQYFTKREDYCHDDEENVYFPDSVYASRLASLPRIIPMPYNNVVRDCIDLYTERRRNLVRYMLGMADYYFPIIEEVLDKHGLPIELKYLAVVESALNPVALSRVGACGLWQFMLPTGKQYGLTINSLVDDRRDPVKATEAACAYFKDMYAIYKDWSLVMASYNCGPGNVNKAIKRSGGKTNFWDIFPYLPKETRSYVPLFIAANYVMNYYCDHNLCPLETNLPLATDTIHVNKMLHLQQVSEVLQVDLEQLRALNPQYKRDIVPGNTGDAVLKLPASDTYAFVDKEDSIYQYRVEEFLPSYLVTISGGSTSGVATREQVTHIVLKNENIYTIANRYGVTPQEIKKWNRLSSNRLARGKRLKLYVDNGGVYLSVKNAQKEKTASASPAQKAEKKDGYIAHKVRSGESLYSIASKYPGVSAQTLKQANNLSDSKIIPGQVLKIPVG